MASEWIERPLSGILNIIESWRFFISPAIKKRISVIPIKIIKIKCIEIH